MVDAPGQGQDAIIDPHHVRRDLAVIERAIVKGWEIPEDWLLNLPAVAARIAADPKKGDRERLRALAVLAAMKRDNTAREALERRTGAGGKRVVKCLVVYEETTEGA